MCATMSTILLVDHDPLSLRVLEVAIRKAGYDVVTAADAGEAHQKTSGQAPDVLVTATRLPGVDGFELVSSLRERSADLPVVLITGAEVADERERARTLGIDDVVARPVFVREIVARVQLLLARRGQRTASSDRASGTTAELALADLLQSLEAQRATGVVHLEQEDESARIWVRDGNVVDAELGRLRGSDVIVRTLSWDRAAFRVEPEPVDNFDLIECTTHALLLRAMDRIDGRTPSLPPAEPEVPAPAPVAAAEVAPKVSEDLPGESQPSTAPWTREATPEDAPAPETEVHVAGLPRRDARPLRRIVIAGASAAAVLVLWAGVKSMHGGPAQETAVAQTADKGPAVAAEAVPPTPPAAVSTGNPATAAATDPSATPENASTPAPAGTDAIVGALASAAPATPAVDPRERALDVKTNLHARSPLVRDAEIALLKGDATKATALAERATATNPADADGWLTLAAARKASGNLAGARDAYATCSAKAFTAGVTSCRVLAAGR
jgi:DNA-binding response OmpR family regulator